MQNPSKQLSLFSIVHYTDARQACTQIAKSSAWKRKQVQLQKILNFKKTYLKAFVELLDWCCRINEQLTNHQGFIFKKMQAKIIERALNHGHTRKCSVLSGAVRSSILHFGEQSRVFTDEAIVHINWEEPNRLG